MLTAPLLICRRACEASTPRRHYVASSFFTKEVPGHYFFAIIIHIELLTTFRHFLAPLPSLHDSFAFAFALHMLPDYAAIFALLSDADAIIFLPDDISSRFVDDISAPPFFIILILCLSAAKRAAADDFFFRRQMRQDATAVSPLQAHAAFAECAERRR